MQRVVFGDVNAATARVLAADGFEVVAPARGSAAAEPSAVHAGRLEEGLERARRLIDVFERADVDARRHERGRLRLEPEGLRPPARGRSSLRRACGGVLGEGARRVGGARRGRAPEPRGSPLPMTVAFQDSCHLLHAQRVRSAPREMLAAIPGLVVAEPAEQELCCGSAGIYNLVQPEAARELGERKAANVLATGRMPTRARIPAA